MSYVVESLDELAALFDNRAADAEKAADTSPNRLIANNWRGEADGWRLAAHITRRTTLKEDSNAA